MAKAKPKGNVSRAAAPVPKSGAGKGVPITRQSPATESWERQIERFFDRLFDDVRLRWPSWTGLERSQPSLRMPAIDVYEEEKAVVVKAELPGIEKDAIDLTVSDHTLTIKGEKKHEAEVKKEHYYRWERSHGSFSRTIDLPSPVDAEHATATFKDGVLQVRLPKGAEDTHTHIAVKAQ